MEYPPLAILVFMGPAAVTRVVVAYKAAFAVEMLLCHAAAVLLVAHRVAGREGERHLAERLGWMTLVTLLLGRLIVTRYDAAPTLVGFAASLWEEAGRGVRGGVLAAWGVGLKAYPAAAAMMALAGDRRWAPGDRRRGGIAFGLTAAALGLAWVIVGGPRGAADSIRFQGGRGLEFGSLASGGQMLAARLVGAPIAVLRDHSSFSTVTPWSGTLGRWVFPVQAAAILAVVVIYVHRGMREGVRYQGAAVLAFIAAGKVFSPQFLIWLVPYLAVLEGPVARRARWLFAAVCALTLLAPDLFNIVPRTSLWVILAYNGRNALVLGLLTLLTCGPMAEPGAPSNPTSAGAPPPG